MSTTTTTTVINFFKKFKYKIAGHDVITINWTDCKRKSYLSLVFFENGFGRRKYKTRGSLCPSKLKNHSYYTNVIVPWKEGFCDLPERVRYHGQ